MRIAIVDCLGCGSSGRRYSTLDVIGVGPRLLVGIIESLGHEVKLILCEEGIKSGLRGFDAVFVSGMATDVESMIRVVQRCGSVPKVAGGPSCVEYLRLLRGGFDYVIYGEAEASVPKLLELIEGSLSESEVPNLIYRVDKEVVKNIRYRFLSREELWRYEPSVEVITKYPGWWGARVYVEVVRGCSNFFRPTIPLPNGRECIGCGRCRVGDLEERLKCPVDIPPGCGYCSVPSLFGPARSRPLSSVLREVEGLIKLGVRRLVLSAPDFLDYGRDLLVAPKPLTNPREPPPNLGAIEELLSSLSSIIKSSGRRVYLMIENIKPNLVNEEVAKVLSKYLRGTSVNVGLETGDEVHHKSLGRPSSVEEVIKAVKLLIKAGLKPYVYLIHGLPGESRSTIKNTVKVVKELWGLGIEKVILYRFTPFKGTAFEGFKKPPPAVKSPTAKKLYYLVRRLNREAKERLLGREVEAVIVSKSKVGNTLIAYTLPHGPVIKVRGGEELIGKLVMVRITNVESDRVVHGLITKVINE